MNSLIPLGRTLIFLGLALILLGIGIIAAARFGLPRLPGDILIQKPGLTVYVPLASALLLSLVLTLLLNLFLRR